MSNRGPRFGDGRISLNNRTSGLGDNGFFLCQLILHLGNVEYGQDITLPNTGTNIHFFLGDRPDRLYEATQLGADVRFLKPVDRGAWQFNRLLVFLTPNANCAALPEGLMSRDGERQDGRGHQQVTKPGDSLQDSAS